MNNLNACFKPISPLSARFPVAGLRGNRIAEEREKEKLEGKTARETIKTAKNARSLSNTEGKRSRKKAAKMA